MENRAEKNIEMRNRGDKEERQRNRDILELREERKGGKLVVGLMHADTAAIMAPAHCLTGPAYQGIAGGKACEVLVHGRGPGVSGITG